MTLPHILVLFFNGRRATRIARIGVRRDRAGGAEVRRGRTRRRILHRVVVRIRAGRPAARPIARNRNRSDARRACRPAPAGTASINRLSFRTVFERDSNPLHTGLRRLLYPNELPNGGRPGIRTRAKFQYAPVCLRLSMAACATATNEVRRRRTSRAL
ncbi:hypothetical protein EMIT0158MI4_70153 [Burkholderia ambifaria]